MCQRLTWLLKCSWEALEDFPHCSCMLFSDLQISLKHMLPDCPFKKEMGSCILQVAWVPFYLPWPCMPRGAQRLSISCACRRAGFQLWHLQVRLGKNPREWLPTNVNNTDLCGPMAHLVIQFHTFRINYITLPVQPSGNAVQYGRALASHFRLQDSTLYTFTYGE